MSPLRDMGYRAGGLDASSDASASSPHREQGLFERFPFGTDITEEEVVLKRALTRLKQTLKGQELSLPGPSDISKVVAVPESARPYLKRLQLDEPQSAAEILMQPAVAYALTSVNAI